MPTIQELHQETGGDPFDSLRKNYDEERRRIEFEEGAHEQDDEDDDGPLYF